MQSGPDPSPPDDPPLPAPHISARVTKSQWARRADFAKIWVRRQAERLALLGHAFLPGGEDARDIIFASLRRRSMARKIGDDREARAAHDIDTRLYQDWIGRFDSLKARDRDAIMAHIAAANLAAPAVVMPFDATTAQFAPEAIGHLQKQLLADFEAIVCFTPECPPQAVTAAKHAARDDPRILISGLPLSADAAPRALKRGVVLAEGGVLLREHALYMMAAAAADHSEPVLVYSDEDHLDPGGVRRRPAFKPVFSPELLRRTGYIGPCALLRGTDPDLVTLLQGAPGALRAHIGELALKLGKAKVIHVPFVLYHDARGRQAWPMPEERLAAVSNLPSVSIIVPTRDRIDLLRPCLASIELKTRYPKDRLEIVIVDNGSRHAETLRYLKRESERGAIRLLRDAGEFNYARLNNLGARHAKGEILIFLNNDTLIDDPDWLKLIVGQVMQRDVAVVGAKLLYPDRTVQFGGTILGIQGAAGHAHVGLAEDDGGYGGRATTTHEVSAVTGACLAIRREIFDELGGLDPALAVACNDVLLCAEALKRGYRNLYLARPIIIHFESKSRGFDTTQEKRELFLDEARHMRVRHRALFQNDPYYNPNLSYERVYDIAFPPRREKPWRRAARETSGRLRVLMLSVVHSEGHGVPVVLRRQAEYLAKLGHEVFVGGPDIYRGIVYPGCERVQLHDPMEAAAYAVAKDIDIVVAHTPPFFSVVRWLGSRPRAVLYDYGEPPPHHFPDAEQRRLQLVEKRFSFGIADRVYAISGAVRAEADRSDMGVIRLGNSHLATWGDALRPRRARVRAARRWDGKAIVLNVCRFHRAERNYKGVDLYAAIAKRFRESNPDLARKTVFVLCGKATTQDAAEVEALGIETIANVSDAELVDIYAAADIYMNFSQWEGYNLGIGQALALGLPVIASDIPAHREFGITTTNNRDKAVRALMPLVEQALAGELLGNRAPKLWTWDEPLAEFASIVEDASR